PFIRLPSYEISDLFLRTRALHKRCQNNFPTLPNKNKSPLRIHTTSNPRPPSFQPASEGFPPVELANKVRDEFHSTALTVISNAVYSAAEILSSISLWD